MNRAQTKGRTRPNVALIRASHIGGLVAGWVGVLLIALTMARPSAAQIGIPPPDPAFSAPTIIGQGSRYYSEWPIMVTEANGSLSVVWSYNLRDHVEYSHSTDGGQTWSDAVTVGGNDLWGGSEGNVNLVADRLGQLHLAHYESYGPGYPHIEYRLRGADGVWHEPIWLPQSADLKMKISNLTVDANGRAYVVGAGRIVGPGVNGLYLYSVNQAGSAFSSVGNLPLVDSSRPNPTWLPDLAASDKGILLVAWGDQRENSNYRLATAWYSNIWNLHIFDEHQGSIWPNGYEQYRVSMTALPDGGIGAAFEGRTEGANTKDIYYRDWNTNLYGMAYSGWSTDTIHFPASDATSEAPATCVDRYGQRYVFWQADYPNLRIVYTYSSDGVTWHPLQMVNGGPHVREKHPSCAVDGNTLNVVWDDRLEGGLAQIYYASRPLPPPYPAPPPTMTVTLTP